MKKTFSVKAATWHDLKRNALKLCSLKGHQMGIVGFTIKTAGSGIYGGATCKKCRRRVIIDTNPPLVGINIGGDAIMVECDIF